MSKIEIDTDKIALKLKEIIMAIPSIDLIVSLANLAKFEEEANILVNEIKEKNIKMKAEQIHINPKNKRYNCSNTLDYGHELQRMCSSINDCWMCPIHHDSGVCKSKISSESISAVQNWSDTHPETDECFEIRKPRKLTEKEVYILKGFKAMGYEYIAVDMTQNVYGFKTAPAKYGYSWYSSDDSQYMCNIAYFFRGVISDGDKKATSIDWLLENKE